MTSHLALQSSRHITILLIENAYLARQSIRSHLDPTVYRVVTSGVQDDITSALVTYQPDLVVLNHDLHDADDFALCGRISAVFSIPLIVVSSITTSASKVRALNLGADDYVTKPYDAAELIARINGILRRQRHPRPDSQRIFEAGPLHIDYDQHLVLLDGKEVTLTGTEYRLLEELVQHAGRTLVADTLLMNVWGYQYEGDFASLHLYISRLRRKLGEDGRHPQFIITKPGVGYMFGSSTAGARTSGHREREQSAGT